MSATTVLSLITFVALALQVLINAAKGHKREAYAWFIAAVWCGLYIAEVA